MNERHRIDIWLKLVCLIKHRSEAAEACRGGHVKVNGGRVKAASPVQEGDVVEFLQGTHYRRVVVQGLPEKPISRELARTMYLDQTPKQEVQAAVGGFRERGSGRPTKRQRRDIDRLKR
jgi:ribosome-associated heat shock protein Hsp15